MFSVSAIQRIKKVSISFALSTVAIAAALSHTKPLQFTLPYFI